MKTKNFFILLLGVNIIVLFSGCLAAEFAGETVGASDLIAGGADLEVLAAEEPVISSFEEGFTIENNAIIIQDVTEVNSNLARVYIKNNNELWINSEKGNIRIANILDENKISLINAGEVTLPGNLYYTKGLGVNVRMGPGYNYEAFASKTIHLENGQLVLIRRVPNSNWWILPMGKDSSGKNIYGYVDSANLLPVVIKTNTSAYDNGKVQDCELNNTGDVCLINTGDHPIHVTMFNVPPPRGVNAPFGYTPNIDIEPHEQECFYQIPVGSYHIQFNCTDEVRQKVGLKSKTINVEQCATEQNTKPIKLTYTIGLTNGYNP